MITYFRKTTIIKIKKPEESGLNKDLKWFSSSIGMFSSRDKEKSCFRIFIELLKALKERKELSSDKIAESTNLSRGTVIHHMNRLMEHGMVSVKNERYGLKYSDLSSLVDNLEENMLDVLKEIKEAARRIDESLELKKE